MAVMDKGTEEFVNTFPLLGELQGKSILITGVTGQIGSTMSRCLSALSDRYDLGISVYGQTRSIASALNKMSQLSGVHFLESEITELRKYIQQIQIDYLIHLAGPTTSLYFVEHPVGTIDAIVNGTREVLDFAKERKVGRVLYVSSMEVYGRVPEYAQPIMEKTLGDIDLTNARSSYPMAKRMAEHLCVCYGLEFGLDVRIARPCQTFGAFLDKSDNRIYAQIARSVKARRDVVLHTRGTSSHCFCDTYDAVSALLYILLRGESRCIYNIANPDTYCSMYEMAASVCDYFKTGSRVRIELDPGKGFPSETKLMLDTSKIRSLGWAPRKNLFEMYQSLIDSME